MALSVEVLQEIQHELNWRVITLETEAENLREDLNEDYLTEECKAMSRNAAAGCDAEAAKVRGLIACIEEELGREKADT
jgi:hypothetical protein